MSVMHEVQVQSDALAQNVYLLIQRINSDNAPSLHGLRWITIISAASS